MSNLVLCCAQGLLVHYIEPSVLESTAKADL